MKGCATTGSCTQVSRIRSRVGASALAVVAAATLYFTLFTVTVSLDGKPMRLRAGTTAGELVKRGLVHKCRGNLVSAKDRHVLEVGEGELPYVSVNGRAFPSATVLSNSLKLTSHNGTDTVEQTRVVTETVEVPTRYVGDGPVESVVSSGTPGVCEVTVGMVSGQVVRSRELVAPIARVVRRTPFPRNTKTVALTFDDGPWPKSTEAILRILKEHGVRATFFMIGRQARQRSSLVKKLAVAGMEMGNHTENHPLLGHVSASRVSKEITRAQRSITKASGKAPKSFRPPGGQTPRKMYPVLRRLHLRLVQWDVDTGDWRRPSAKKIVSRVLRQVKPGAVVLMHDGGGDRRNTVKALPTIIKKLRAKGYVFVTVDELRKVPHWRGK